MWLYERRAKSPAVEPGYRGIYEREASGDPAVGDAEGESRLRYLDDVNGPGVRRTFWLSASITQAHRPTAVTPPMAHSHRGQAEADEHHRCGLWSGRSIELEHWMYVTSRKEPIGAAVVGLRPGTDRPAARAY